MVECVIGGNVINETGDDLVPKSKLLVCGHAVCAFDLDNIRDIRCPICRQPLAGPLVTPKTIANAKLRLEAEATEEKIRQAAISQLTIEQTEEMERNLGDLPPTERRIIVEAEIKALMNNVYDKSVEDLLKMLHDPEKALIQANLQFRPPAPNRPPPPSEAEMKALAGSPGALARILAEEKEEGEEGEEFPPALPFEFGHPVGGSPFAIQAAPFEFGQPLGGSPVAIGEFPGEEAPLSPSILAQIAAIEAATANKPPEPSSLSLDMMEAIARSQNEVKGQAPRLSPTTFAALQKPEKKAISPVINIRPYSPTRSPGSSIYPPGMAPRVMSPPTSPASSERLPLPGEGSSRSPRSRPGSPSQSPSRSRLGSPPAQPSLETPIPLPPRLPPLQLPKSPTRRK